ncbi:MAG: hypothetical protein IJ572_00770 [Bacilli bacterium]|nr:hypothetical protein [Bacilli bacterium]
MALDSNDVQGTYKQAHASSSNSLSANFTRGKYFVMLYYSYGGGIQANNYSSISQGGIGLTPTNGTCTTIDSYFYGSGGNSVAYSSNYRFNNTLRFGFFLCDFKENGSVTSTTYATNNYDPDTYVMRYIRLKD